MRTLAQSPLDDGAEGPPEQEGAILFLVASTGWGCEQREGQDEGWELDPHPYPACRGLETQATAAQPRPSLSPISTCPGPAGVWHSSSSLLPHVSLGPGTGSWVLPEDIKGSSQIQGLGGGSGVVLRPVSGRLQGSEIPGGRTQTRWTEMSKASSSWGLRL